jgi:hypothetical protein
MSENFEYEANDEPINTSKDNFKFLFFCYFRHSLITQVYFVKRE